MVEKTGGEKAGGKVPATVCCLLRLMSLFAMKWCGAKLGAVLRMGWDCAGTVLELCWGCARVVLRISWDCAGGFAGAVLGMCWDLAGVCAGVVLSFFTYRLSEK